MKRTLCVVVLILALPAGLLPYENTPAPDIIIPEVVWAEATGGGTWVTELQMSESPGTYGSDVAAIFFYGSGVSARIVISLWISPGNRCSVKWPNILSTMQSLDSGFTYYGHSGTLWLQTQDEHSLISAVARTYNGNNGKTFPGLQWTDSNTANVGRDMMIMNVMFSPDYRTFAGFFNATSTTQVSSMVCEMSLIDANGVTYGTSWYEAFGPWEYKAFDIFAKAGITSGTHDNLRLIIHPLMSGNSGNGSKGLFCYGSMASNTTNDTYAIIAVQLFNAVPPLPSRPVRGETSETIDVTFM